MDSAMWTKPVKLVNKHSRAVSMDVLGTKCMFKIINKNTRLNFEYWRNIFKVENKDIQRRI